MEITFGKALTDEGKGQAVEVFIDGESMGFAFSTRAPRANSYSNWRQHYIDWEMEDGMRERLADLGIHEGRGLHSAWNHLQVRNRFREMVSRANERRRREERRRELAARPREETIRLEEQMIATMRDIATTMMNITDIDEIVRLASYRSMIEGIDGQRVSRLRRLVREYKGGLD